ncbi:MAG: GGDEF domain-containing protein [Lachnospiraceae bacterium]|nr:GGDEF domain-containing protein [Lachnospiraceae bacterium]
MVALSEHIQSIDFNRGNEINLNADWDVTLNGEKIGNYELSKLILPSMNVGDKLELECDLPRFGMPNPVLMFYSLHSEVTVFIDGVKQYEYGDNLYKAGKFIGDGYHYVTLSERSMGKSLKLVFKPDLSNPFSSVQTPIIVNAVDAKNNFYRSKAVPLIIDTFLIALGCSLLVICLVFEAAREGLGRLANISSFAILMGLWSLCNFDLMQLFVNNLEFKGTLEYICLLLAPIFVLRCFKPHILSMGNQRAKMAYYITIYLLVAFSIVAIFFHIFGIISIGSVLMLWHGMLAVIGIEGILLLVSDIKNKKMDNSLLWMGTALMVTFSFIDLVRYNIFEAVAGIPAPKYSSFASVGSLLLVLSLFVDYAQQITMGFVVNMKNAALEKIAYVDEMTGLMNRRSFEEELDALDKSDFTYALVSMDINNLKTVNDTMGHDIGDELIETFGSILSASLGNHTGYRVGGDEFAIIVKKPNEHEAERLIDSFNKSINEYNGKSRRFLIKMAYGIAYSDKDQCTSSRMLYKIADERMYERKIIMKQGDIR